MNRRKLMFSVVTLGFLLGAVAYPQNQDPPPAVPEVLITKPVKPQFFAGQVVEIDVTHVKVSRNLVGRAPETRVFVLDSKTKTPKGGIKVKARVTVRFEHHPESDLALEIQVRPFNHLPKAS